MSCFLEQAPSARKTQPTACAGWGPLSATTLQDSLVIHRAFATAEQPGHSSGTPQTLPHPREAPKAQMTSRTQDPPEFPYGHTRACGALGPMKGTKGTCTLVRVYSIQFSAKKVTGPTKQTGAPCHTTSLFGGSLCDEILGGSDELG